MLAEHLDSFKKYLPDLKKGNGDQWRGSCPFHHEKTPENKSFSVNVNTGQYKCFNPICCAHVGGNAKTFSNRMETATNNRYNNFTIKPWGKKEIAGANYGHSR